MPLALGKEEAVPSSRSALQTSQEREAAAALVEIADQANSRQQKCGEHCDSFNNIEELGAAYLHEKVYQYYAKFGDYTDAFPKFKRALSPSFKGLSFIERSFLEYFLKERYSASRWESLFPLLQAAQGDEEQCHFEYPSTFSAYAH